MMSSATIRVNCPDCGQVDIRDTTMVSISLDQQTYHFECPDCGSVFSKRADKKIVGLLVSAGVELTPPPPPHPEDVPLHAEPLTNDDLIDFHLSFDQELAEFLDGN